MDRPPACPSYALHALLAPNRPAADRRALDAERPVADDASARWAGLPAADWRGHGREPAIGLS